jgi:hypothetical protein
MAGRRALISTGSAGVADALHFAQTTLRQPFSSLADVQLGSVRTSTRRYPARLLVRMTVAQAEALRSWAAAYSLSQAGALRVLIDETMRTQPAGSPLKRTRAHEDGCATGLAGLVAAEHTRLLLERIVPDGRRLSEELRETAAIAADRRLDDLAIATREGGR